jgi:hypothetical protein
VIFSHKLTAFSGRFETASKLEPFAEKLAEFSQSSEARTAERRSGPDRSASGRSSTARSLSHREKSVSLALVASVPPIPGAESPAAADGSSRQAKRRKSPKPATQEDNYSESGTNNTGRTMMIVAPSNDGAGKGRPTHDRSVELY